MVRCGSPFSGATSTCVGATKFLGLGLRVGQRR